LKEPFRDEGVEPGDDDGKTLSGGTETAFECPNPRFRKMFGL
jgi:hypothetical protein